MCVVFFYDKTHHYPLVNGRLHNELERSTMLFMGKPWENGDLYGKTQCFNGKTMGNL